MCRMSQFHNRCHHIAHNTIHQTGYNHLMPADGAVMCAAVADYTPEEVAPTKLKKGDGELTIRLRRTKDIAAELGSRKGGRVLVGFALETDDEEAHAREKLRRKHFDFVVLNSPRKPAPASRSEYQGECYARTMPATFPNGLCL